MLHLHSSRHETDTFPHGTRTSDRVLTLVTPTFYPEPTGTPHYATDLAQWFDARGWKVRVVTAQPYYPLFELYEGYGRARRHDRLGNIEILRLPTLVPDGRSARQRMTSELNFVLQGLVRGQRFRSNIVLSISPGVPWTSIIGRALTKSGGRHLALVHDIQSGLAESLGMASPKVRGLMRLSERSSLNMADEVGVLTHEMGRELIDMGVTKPVQVLPLWATVKGGTDLVERVQPDNSVQYSGNFGQKQGIGSLLELAGEIQNRAPDVRMLFRGAGPKFENLRMDAAARGINNIDYEAPVSAEELPGALAKSPVHIVLQAPGSTRYAMPSKVVNALACGSHVVAMTEEPSTLHRMATELEGLEAVGIGDVGTMAHQVLLRLHDHKREARRQQIAIMAEKTFARDVVLEGFERNLLGYPTALGSQATAKFGAQPMNSHPGELTLEELAHLSGR